MSWMSLLIPNEVVDAYGISWRIAVFTGKCKGDTASGSKEIVDDRGRSERIDVRELEVAMGDRISMALFIHPDGGHASYFYLYNHTRQAAIEYSEVAFGDLWYRKNPQWSRKSLRKGLVVAIIAIILLPDLHNASGHVMPFHIRAMVGGLIGMLVSAVIALGGPGRDYRRFQHQMPGIIRYVQQS